jgi:hypothetical protein
MSNARVAIAATMVALVSASMLLTGCSAAVTGAPATGSDPVAAASHAAKPVVTACTVVTEQDASSALGSDPGPGTAAAQSGVTACTYGAAPHMVSVHVSPAGKAEYDQMHAAPVDGATPVDLSGIGDGAFGIFATPVASIAFYRGTSYVSIVILSDGSQARAVTLATTAAGRL